MSKIESPTFIERMPTPGNVAHLEYLSALEVSENSTLWDPEAYLTETNAATTLAKLIRRHRSFWHIMQLFKNEVHVSLDTRLDEVLDEIEREREKIWPKHFDGSLDIYPPIILPRLDGDFSQEMIDGLVESRSISMNPEVWPADIPVTRFSKNALSIGGRSNPAGHPESTYEYSLWIPIDEALFYDPTRRLLGAAYTKVYPDTDKTVSGVYNHGGDPAIFHRAARRAAIDLKSFMDFVYGQRDKVRAGALYPAINVRWIEDYLTDDPDELLSEADKKEKQKPKTYYLGDDPDEFIKAA